MKWVFAVLMIFVLLWSSVVLADDEGNSSLVNNRVGRMRADGNAAIPGGLRDRMPVPSPVMGEGCKVDPALVREFNDLTKGLRQSENENASELKTKIESLGQRIRAERQKCMEQKDNNTAQRASPKCPVSEDLRKELDDAWQSYKALLASDQDEDFTAARQRVKDAIEGIIDARKDCLSESMPAWVKECRADALDDLEGLWVRYRFLRRQGKYDQIDSEKLKDKISGLEEKFRQIRARCLTMPAGATSQEISSQFSQELSSIGQMGVPEEQVERLKSLRKEIDEAIKNLIEQKKKLNYSELSMAQEIIVTADSIEIGETPVNSSQVEIEVEVGGEPVYVASDNDSAVLVQEDLIVDAQDIMINSSGISVDGAEVKISPKRLLEHKALENNRQRIQDLRIEKDGERAVYKARFEAKKRFLGIFPATAEQTVEVDALTGEVISEGRPWWVSISTEAK